MIPKKLLAVLIVLVGTAGVVVAGLATFAAVRDRTVSTRPGPVRSVEVDVAVGRRGRRRRQRRGQGGPYPAVHRRCAADHRDAGRRRPPAHGVVPNVRPAGCKVDYRVEVPGAVSVQVRTERGSVQVENMTGTVEVETEAGGVRLVGTRGPVRATTSAGNVEGVDLVAGFIDAITDAGRIRLSLAEPSARVDLRTDAATSTWRCRTPRAATG